MSRKKKYKAWPHVYYSTPKTQFYDPTFDAVYHIELLNRVGYFRSVVFCLDDFSADYSSLGEGRNLWADMQEVLDG